MFLKIWFYMGFWYAVRDAKVKYFAQTIHPYRAGRNATCNMRLYNTDKREYDKKCQCRKIHKTCIKGWLHLVIRQSDNGRSNRSVGQKKPWRNQCSQPIKKRSDLKNIVSLSTSVISFVLSSVVRPCLNHVFWSGFICFSPITIKLCTTYINLQVNISEW